MKVYHGWISPPTAKNDDISFIRFCSIVVISLPAMIARSNGCIVLMSVLGGDVLLRWHQGAAYILHAFPHLYRSACRPHPGSLSWGVSLWGSQATDVACETPCLSICRSVPPLQPCLSGPDTQKTLTKITNPVMWGCSKTKTSSAKTHFSIQNRLFLYIPS